MQRLLICLAVLICCAGCNHRASDSSIIAQFKKNKATFDQLASMAVEDSKLTALFADHSFDDEELTKERAAQYIKLIEAAGLESATCWRFQEGRNIEFRIFPYEWKEGPRLKMLVYTTDLSGPRKRNLDTPGKEPSVPLAPNWYLNVRNDAGLE